MQDFLQRSNSLCFEAVEAEVGIIGNEFWNVWESRTEVLLVTRIRRALYKWGYAAKDVKALFEYVAPRLKTSF